MVHHNHSIMCNVRVSRSPKGTQIEFYEASNCIILLSINLRRFTTHELKKLFKSWERMSEDDQWANFALTLFEILSLGYIFGVKCSLLIPKFSTLRSKLISLGIYYHLEDGCIHSDKMLSYHVTPLCDSISWVNNDFILSDSYQERLKKFNSTIFLSDMRLFLSNISYQFNDNDFPTKFEDWYGNDVEKESITHTNVGFPELTSSIKPILDAITSVRKRTENPVSGYYDEPEL